MRKLTYLLTLLSLHIGLGQSSVLSTGQWFKVGITASGIYKLDQATFSGLGIDATSLDPGSIRIFGNGVQGMLPQRNDSSRPFDLLENNIYVEGETDGSFDASDYVLFYGVGPDKVVWGDSGLEYEKNIYADTSYYFISVGGAAGSRVAEVASLPGDGIVTALSDDFIVFEDDQNNLLGSGRGWYGELMTSGETATFNHSIPNLATDVQLVLSGVGQSFEDNSLGITTNGVSLGSVEIGSVIDATYSIKARQALDTFLISQNSDLQIQVAYDGNASNARGFIDYYLLLFKRTMSLNGAQTTFRSADNVGSLIQYEIGNAASATIWNVTDPTNVQQQQHNLQGSTATFQSQSTDVERFVVFSGSDFPAPSLFGPVATQDLKNDTQIDGVIITDPTFQSEAERLKAFHEEHDNLRVKVVTPKQIYNEFSSGRQDITAIRDYVKYVHEEGGSLRYLLLFGDCSYDYKYRTSNNTNFVPTYESRDSFDPVLSHSSDDYFGFFEDDEGEWVESVAGDHTMEIGIGRLPVKSIAEAQVVVDKIIYYATSPNTLGKWRNEMAYLADDGDSNIHASHAEDLSQLIDTTHQQYNIDKLLLDAFNQNVGASSESSPEATKALKSKVKSGAFVINFIGHGNERLWTAEEVLTRSLIQDFTNRNKLPIFVTATCEFGRYDDPIQVSGAEELLLSDHGGAIALLTTSRPVFASTNFGLNQAFHENIFKKQNGEFQRLGDIIRVTKNEGLAGSVNRNFTLLGDPMMMPAYPELDVVISELSSENDTLSALEEVTFTGQIETQGALQSDFNGRLAVSIFDIEQNFRTKGQQSAPFNYTLRNNSLFRGESTVTDGTFSFTFVVPKNISYQFSSGKMSLYAWDEEGNIDAGGSSSDFVLGGTATGIASDTQAPIVNMYLNDETFVNGTTVGSSSLLIANIEDQNGISITSNGLSLGISLELAGEVINLNEFYSADLDTYQRGSVAYPIQDLAPGTYTATLKVYDTHNNLSEETIDFIVSDDSFISIFNPVAYPNPVQEYTTFSFEHDREEEDLEMTLLVYNVHGEVMNTSNYEFENSDRLVEILWEPRTTSGQLLTRGIYLYRLIVRSRLDGAVKEITNRLVIIN